MGIPADCLVSAVFSPECTDSLVEPHAYDSASLQEICGCLIRTSNFGFEYINNSRMNGKADDSFETISLAHYTVKEFIYSERITNTTIAYFSSSEGDTTHEFLGAILRICATLNLERKPRYFFENLCEYCREIARLAPMYWENSLTEDDKLLDLQFKYLESPRYDLLPEHRRGVFNEDNDFSDFYTCWWDLTSYPLVTRQSLTLLSLLQYRALEMCSKFLEDLDFESIICAPLEVNLNDANSIARGNILEVLHEDDWVNSIDSVSYLFFFELCQSRLDTRTWFMTYLSAHDHKYICTKLSALGKRCPIEGLLEDGFDPDLPGLSVTPLQLAVFHLDFISTKILLRYHANPNGTGDPNGKRIPNLDPIWGQKSPLHITRNAEPELDATEDIWHRHREIEKILLKHGAEDFVMDIFGIRVPTGGQSPIIEVGTDSEEGQSNEDEGQSNEDESQSKEDESQSKEDK